MATARCLEDLEASSGWLAAITKKIMNAENLENRDLARADRARGTRFQWVHRCCPRVQERPDRAHTGDGSGGRKAVAGLGCGGCDRADRRQAIQQAKHEPADAAELCRLGNRRG